MDYLTTGSMSTSAVLIVERPAEHVATAHRHLRSSRSRIVLRDGVEELGEVQAVLLFRLVRWV
jgi:hypothetical protein